MTTLKHQHCSTETVVLGGTHQERDYNTQVCPKDKKIIVEGCCRYVPGLRFAHQFVVSFQVDRIAAMSNIAVIGAGVNGVSSAIKILEHYKTEAKTPIRVTILSEDFSPNTTGDGSAGLWGPYLLGGTSQSKV